MMPNQESRITITPGGGRVADAAAHRLPARMADVDGVDERVAHQAADQADHAVGGQHARGREAVARDRRALDVVHRLDQVVDAERDRGDQDDAEELEAREHVAERRERHARSRSSRPTPSGFATLMPPKLQAERGRAPGDQRARRRSRPGPAGMPPSSARRRTSSARMIAKQTMPMTGVMNISSAGRMEMKVIDTPASVPSSAARGVILRMTGAMKPPDHQHEALDEHPGEPRLPALDRIAGLERDRQHDHEHDDEHVRHADARGQRADVGAPGLLAPAGRRATRSRACSGTASARSPAGCARTRCSSGIFSTKRSSAGQRQQVDEDVGAEAEEGVPVAGHPEFGFADASSVARRLVACSTRVQLASAARMLRRVARPSRRCRPAP